MRGAKIMPSTQNAVNNHQYRSVQRSTASSDDVLMDAGKRYRVDTEKLQKAVAEELAARRDKKTRATAKSKGRNTGA
jgi:hypothetical protein